MPNTPSHVLVVEDNPGDRLLIEDYLQEQIPQLELVHAGTLAQASQRLEERSDFDVVLLDLTLPDATGEPLVKAILDHLHGQTPLIVLTGRSTHDLGVSVLQLGVEDYLLKNELTAEHLYKSITYGIERHRISNRMAQTARRLKNAQDIARLGYWEYDFATDRLYWSEETFEILGADPESFEMRFENFRRMVHPDDLAAFDASRKAAIFEGMMHDIEHRIIRPDGTVAHVYQRGEMVRDAAGKPQRLEGIIQDITHRKEQEEHLLLLESAITHAKDVIMITDTEINEPGPHILFVNEAFTEMTGYAASEALGRSPRFLQGDDTDKEEMRRIREALIEQEDCQVELINYHKNGSPYWVELSIVPVTNAQGRCTHFISIERDITERKHNEALLRDFADNLEKKVLQRTEELQKAHKMLNYQHRHIRDSINYAKRIQEAIIPTEEELQAVVPESFVLFKPLDVVSGDFLWYGQTDNGITLVAAVDCTGHGVPGALMSMIGHQLLDQLHRENNARTPSELLYDLHRNIRILFRRGKNTQQEGAPVADAMDVALCAIDHSDNTVSFCGARRPLFIATDKEVRQVDESKFTIGGEDRMQVDKQLETTTVQAAPGTCIYLTSDGYYDQFGGPNDRKMLKKRFMQHLTEIRSLPMPDQKAQLDEYFQDWKGRSRQTDDVLVVGIRL